jgi:hypothetical protein
MVEIHSTGRPALRVRFAFYFLSFLTLGANCALAQQTVTVPPAAFTLPSTRPQTEAFTACVVNCDTAVGACHGRCNVNNSPLTTFAPSIAGTRPDPGALSQCHQSCIVVQLTCKQSCRPPP